MNAQFKKGMRMVGATIGNAFFNSGKSDYSYPPPTTGYTSNSNNFGVTLNPSMGWFVSDNVISNDSVLEHMKARIREKY